jgi:hypothetical protein
VGALDQYVARTRRLLTDGGPNFYFSNDAITDAINEARRKVANFTGCLRQLVTDITLPQGQELYNVSQMIDRGTPPNLGTYFIELKGITTYWDGTRVKCVYRPFAEQDVWFRSFTQGFTGPPASMAMMGSNIVYLNPTPDRDYQSDWDVVFTAIPLGTSSDLENIPTVYQDCIPYAAASIAKFGEQSLSESDVFLNKYRSEMREACFAHFKSRVRDPYRR